MPDKFLFAPVPNEQAMAFIRNKPVVTRDVFDKLLPELKARAFTVTGIESANVLQKLRDRIADLPAGANWDDIKGDMVNEISPYLVDPAADKETQDAQIAASERRAELLLRTHGFEAYQAASYEVMDRQRDVFEYWQYMTMEDEAVRDEHAALDGLILPADSSFWDDHYPPWDWGCRCQVAPLLEEEKQAVENGDSEYGKVLSDVQEQRLVQDGTLDLGDGHQINVSSPAASGKEGAFSWHPESLQIPLDQLEQRYDPEVWKTFRSWAVGQSIDSSGLTVWGWLNQEPPLKQIISAKPILPAKIVPAVSRQNPVSDALTVKVRGGVAETIRHAISVIDQVHDDGSLPQINILANRGNSLGVYTRRGSKAVSIKILKDGPWPGLSTIHEIGHFLDHQALGSIAGYGSEQSKSLDLWRNAIKSSKAIEQINFANIAPDRREYYLREKELFARSYAQYITEKSADPQLLAELEKSRNSSAPWRQWSTEDFAPIREAMDKAFETEGWL